MIDRSAIRVLADIPRAQAAARPERVALAWEAQTLTYRQLAKRVAETADALSSLGVKRGDRVAWLGRSCQYYHLLFFGLAELGACLTPLNYRLSAAELEYILRDSGAGLLFATDDRITQAQIAAARLDAPPTVIAIEQAYGQPGAGSPPAREASADTDILQLYTSGTTGHPKGVRLTNSAYSAFLELSPQVEGFNYDADDTVLIVMPLFHVAGFNVSTMGLAHGCRVILLDQFSPSEVLRLMAEERVAQVFLAPSMIQALLADPLAASTDFSALKVIGYGASPIAESTLRRAQETFGCGFVQFYGMTESAAAGSFLAPSAHTPDRLLSCGRAWPGTEMRIERADGSEAAVGEVGEIVIRGPTLMAGYMNRADATADTLRGGWLHTGDAGYRDADGFFYVHDRIKDMIVSGGENVYPAEVEQAIMGCPGVADVAVIGVPSERWGEEVLALVVLEPQADATRAEIINWTRARIAGFKTPKSVQFIEALPRNASGKVLRRELREPFWHGRERAVG